MKKTKQLSITIIILTSFLLASCNGNTVTNTGESLSEYTGDDVALALSKLGFDPREHSYDPPLVLFNDQLYTIYSELNGAKQIRVQKWDGAKWNFIDQGLTDGLNYDAGKFAYEPQLIEYNSMLYAIWYELNGTTRQVRVKKWDGANWEFVDGGSVNGLNYDSAHNASSPQLSVFEEKLYAVWMEEDGSGSREIKVKTLNGSSWSSESGLPAGLPYTPRGNSGDPQISVFNLY